MADLENTNGRDTELRFGEGDEVKANTGTDAAPKWRRGTIVAVYEDTVRVYMQYNRSSKVFPKGDVQHAEAAAPKKKTVVMPAIGGLGETSFKELTHGQARYLEALKAILDKQMLLALVEREITEAFTLIGNKS